MEIRYITPLITNTSRVPGFFPDYFIQETPYYKISYILTCENLTMICFTSLIRFDLSFLQIPFAQRYKLTAVE